MTVVTQFLPLFPPVLF